MELSIEISRMKPGVVTLSLIGPIDENSSPTLDKEICEALAEPVEILVLDMAGVDFITSSGVGIIVKAKTSLKRRGANLVIMNLQSQVEKVFEIIHLTPVLEVFESREELDEYLVKVQQNIKGEDG